VIEDRMRLKEINSVRNTTFKLFLRLTKSRGIKKHGLSLLSGHKQVSEVLKDFPDDITIMGNPARKVSIG